MLGLMRCASHDVHRENIFVVLGRLDITGGGGFPKTAVEMIVWWLMT